MCGPSSTSTGSGRTPPAPPGAAAAAPPAWAPAALAQPARPPTGFAPGPPPPEPATLRPRQPPLHMPLSVCSSRLPEPALGGELHQRGFHLPSVEPHAHHVQPRVLRLFRHPVLPLGHAAGQLRQFAPREHPCAARLDIERLHP